MRTDDELKSIIEDIKIWYLEDTGETLDPVLFKYELGEERQARIKNFVFKRLAHLKNKDFFRFLRLYEEDLVKNVPVKASKAKPAKTES